MRTERYLISAGRFLRWARKAFILTLTMANVQAIDLRGSLDPSVPTVRSALSVSLFTNFTTPEESSALDGFVLLDFTPMHEGERMSLKDFHGAIDQPLRFNLLGIDLTTTNLTVFQKPREDGSLPVWTSPAVNQFEQIPFGLGGDVDYQGDGDGRALLNALSLECLGSFDLTERRLPALESRNR